MEAQSKPTKKRVSKTKPGSNRATVVRAIQTAAKGAHTVSVEDAGRLLGYGRDAAYLAAKRGTLPTIKLNSRHWRVSVAVVERLLLGE